MFQSFEQTASPEFGPARLRAVREACQALGVDGFLVPRADAHQGEYVAPRDDRLAWLTGFTGSAGWAVVLPQQAGVFVDSRYRVQVRQQVDPVFTPVDWPEVSLGAWICEHAATGSRLGYDAWLVTPAQLRGMIAQAPEIAFVACENPVDRAWEDQPAAPSAPVFEQPEHLTGESRSAKLERIADGLGRAEAVVITLPDSLAWLLNIRGADIPKNPVPHGFAILHKNRRVDLFMPEAKLAEVDLGPRVVRHDPETLLDVVGQLGGPVQIDPNSAPVCVLDRLEAAGIEVIEDADPCLLPKATKTQVEIEGARAAHLRDGAAMVRFLAWLDAQTPGGFSEIDVVRRLEAERRATNALRDISFDTISGAGPHGAIVHYRVTEDSNAIVEDGQLLLVDSGGQYVDGTTDITRTIAVGDVGQTEKACFTRVLQGMIAISRARWPKGLAGRDLDALARVALWQAGLDYGHGTGHGVGSYLSVHEGPQRLARTGTVPFEPGMILSNEPGFYREGAFGIRIENLIVVQEAPALPDQTIDGLLEFETLTFVPIDRRLIVTQMLTDAESEWLNAYHRSVEEKIGPLVEGAARAWLALACAPL